MSVSSPAQARPVATAAAPVRTRTVPAPTPGEHGPRRHLRPVPAPRAGAPATRRHVRPRVALTAAIGVLFAVLFGVAVLQTAIVQGQLRLDGVRADVAERQTDAQVLRAEVARQSSPENVVAEAEGLGLVPPDHTTFLPPPSTGTP